MTDKKESLGAPERRIANNASQRACRARKRENGYVPCNLPYQKRKNVQPIKDFAQKLEDKDNE